MPYCIEDFTAEYDGRMEQMHAGRDWVIDGHELARRYPEKFSAKRPARRSASSIVSGQEGLRAATRTPLRTGKQAGSSWPKTRPAWLLPAPPYRPDVDDFYTKKNARHEAAHATAAYLLGWKVTGAEIRADGSGICHVFHPAHLDRVRKQRELAIICHVSRAHAGWSPTDSLNYRSDDKQAWKAVNAVTTHPTEAQQLRDALQAQARELEASGKFRWIARRVADELLERGRLDATELGPLLREASLEYRRRAA